MSRLKTALVLAVMLALYGVVGRIEYDAEIALTAHRDHPHWSSHDAHQSHPDHRLDARGPDRPRALDTQPAGRP